MWKANRNKSRENNNVTLEIITKYKLVGINKKFQIINTKLSQNEKDLLFERFGAEIRNDCLYQPRNLKFQEGFWTVPMCSK
jgi:hypothetical protein